jgi:Tfp pilus assembly protein PilN
MPRQINLYSPSLREPQRHFVVRSMLQGVAVFSVALLALCGWALWRSAELQRELASAETAFRTEQQRLGRNLAAVPAATDATALNQELAQAQQALARQRGVLAERQAAAQAEGARPGPWLQLLARSTPPAVWLTTVRSAGPRVEIEGYTLHPEALRPWLDRVTAEAPSGARALAAVAVQREAGLPVGEAWSFRIVSGTAEAATGAAP